MQDQFLFLDIVLLLCFYHHISHWFQFRVSLVMSSLLLSFFNVYSSTTVSTEMQKSSRGPLSFNSLQWSLSQEHPMMQLVEEKLSLWLSRFSMTCISSLLFSRTQCHSCSSAAVDDPGQLDVILAEAGALANTALPVGVLGGDGGTTICAERLWGGTTKHRWRSVTPNSIYSIHKML